MFFNYEKTWRLDVLKIKKLPERLILLYFFCDENIKDIFKTPSFAPIRIYTK